MDHEHLQAKRLGRRREEFPGADGVHERQVGNLGEHRDGGQAGEHKSGGSRRQLI